MYKLEEEWVVKALPIWCIDSNQISYLLMNTDIPRSSNRYSQSINRYCTEYVTFKLNGIASWCNSNEFNIWKEYLLKCTEGVKGWYVQGGNVGYELHLLWK